MSNPLDSNYEMTKFNAYRAISPKSTMTGAPFYPRMNYNIASTTPSSINNTGRMFSQANYSIINPYATELPTSGLSNITDQPPQIYSKNGALFPGTGNGNTLQTLTPQLDPRSLSTIGYELISPY